MSCIFVFTEPMCIPRTDAHKIVVLDCDDYTEADIEEARSLVLDSGVDLRLSEVILVDGQIHIRSISCVTLRR